MHSQPRAPRFRCHSCRLPDATLANPKLATSRRGTVGKVLLGVLIVVGAAGGVLAWQGKIFRKSDSGDSKNLIFEPVKKGPLEITITERGNLESAQNSTVVCMVEGEAGVGILEIVEEGKLVKKDDILVK